MCKIKRINSKGNISQTSTHSLKNVFCADILHPRLGAPLLNEDLAVLVISLVYWFAVVASVSCEIFIFKTTTKRNPPQQG